MKIPDEPTVEYLKKIVPVVQNAYTSTVRVVDDIDTLKDVADLAQVDFGNFARSYAHLILLIDHLITSNQELRDVIAAHVVLTKLTNAITLAKNVKALQEVDPAMIGLVIRNVRSQQIMTDALAETVKLEGGEESLEWLAEALKQNGF